MKSVRTIIVLFLILTLVACSSPAPPPPPVTTGAISGKIVGFGATEVSFADLPPGSYVPGEVIVGFYDDANQGSIMQTAGVNVQNTTPLAVPGAVLIKTGGADAVAVAEAMSEQPNVRYAHPNYILNTFASPNDTLWQSERSEFWHYDAIHMEPAWDISTGNANIVVAVIDSGILVDNDGTRPSHPDLEDSVLPGYDFISDPTMAGDGDGRDDDPYDPGKYDDRIDADDYHGTHVAGTIGATTNNHLGIPAVGWDVSILPVRALGRGGGTIVDIMESALWAAGLPVANVDPNLHPADVINMSLGAPVPCAPFAQDALRRIATETNAVVVAAAGNDAEDVLSVTPAGCPDVITVAASGYSQTGADGDLASYSNFGHRVDVTAPGGDNPQDFINPTDGNYVYSTGVEVTQTGPEIGYTYRAGTSMAAPHVSGVAALMKSVDPTLSADTIRAIIRGTANGAFAQNCPNDKRCGMGMLDAAAALTALSNPPSLFTAEPRTLDFFRDNNSLRLTLTNTSGAPLLWETTLAESWISGPENGVVGPKSSETYTYTVTRNGLQEGESKSAVLSFKEQGSSTFATVFAHVAKQTAYEVPNGPTYVLSWYEDPGAPGGWADGAFYREPSPFSSYHVPAEAGKHIVAVLVDADNSSDISVGDWYGSTDSTVRVRPGRTTFAPDITVGPYTGSTSSEIPLSRIQEAIDSLQ